MDDSTDARWVTNNMGFNKMCQIFYFIIKRCKKINLIVVLNSAILVMYSVIGFSLNVFHSGDMKSDNLGQILFTYLQYLMCLLKFVTMLFNIKHILNTLTVTRFDVLISRHCQLSTDKLLMLKNRNKMFCYFYTSLMVVTAVVPMLLPLMLNYYFMSLENPTNFIRKNVVNFYYLISEETYHKWFFFFYINEAIFVISVLFFGCMFDYYFLSVCWAIATQYETLTTGLMSFGHNMNKKKKKKQMYEDLKVIISDCQRMHLYTKEFYTVVRRIILLQIVICSCSLIIWCFIISLQLATRSCGLRSILPLISCVAAGVQQFMYSYFLDKLNEKKDDMNFGLYSCDWTAMDIRFKKLLLSAMAMNNANQLKCKATPNKVVDLKLFLSTLRVSYSVVSVMLNVQLKSLDGN